MIERLSLIVRKRLPPSVRRLLRLCRHVLVRGQASQWIPPELFNESRLCASRQDMVRQLTPNGKVAEVGTERGHFALHILAATDPSELHLIDLDFTQLDPALRSDPRVVLHQGRSTEVMASFPDSYFDWIYIDADHSYRGAARDAEASSTKVKPGGVIAFNDFAHADPYLGAYGVHRAVVDFIVKNRWPLAWLAYEPNALYDVAVRRPSVAQ